MKAVGRNNGKTAHFPAEVLEKRPVKGFASIWVREDAVVHVSNNLLNTTAGLREPPGVGLLGEPLLISLQFNGRLRIVCLDGFRGHTRLKDTPALENLICF